MSILTLAPYFKSSLPLTQRGAGFSRHNRIHPPSVVSPSFSCESISSSPFPLDKRQTRINQNEKSFNFIHTLSLSCALSHSCVALDLRRKIKTSRSFCVFVSAHLSGYLEFALHDVRMHRQPRRWIHLFRKQSSVRIEQ